MQDYWRPVRGYEGHYAVSRDGHIRSIKRNKLLSLVKTRNGYLRVNLYIGGKPRAHLVHRVVLEAFQGPLAEGMTVHHVDCCKRNNKLSNLRAVSLEENRAAAERDGLLRPFKGEANPRAKLKEGDVYEIRRLWAEGKTRVRDIANRFGVTDRTVYLIAYRELWRHLD